MVPSLLRGPWCGAPDGSEKRGVVVLTVVVVVVVVTALLCPCRGCSVTGITAVQWTLLHNVSVSWNQASVLCRMRGLHLPSPRSHLAVGGLQQALLTWAQWLPDGFWLGLYSEEPGQRPRRWEGDCGSLCTEVTVWGPGEPDEPSRQMCVRTEYSGTLQTLMWKTEACDATFPVVCEVELGRNCTFEVLQSSQVTSSHVNMTLSDISDITSCLSACQNTTKSGLQCVAVQRIGIYDVHSHTCQLLFGPTLLTTADVHLDLFSTTALRQCFMYDVDDPVTSADGADTGLYPRPACPCNQSSSSSSSSPSPATSTTSSMGWTSRYCEQSTSDTTLSTSVPPDGLQAGGTVTNVSVDDHPWTTDDPAAGQGQSGDTASDSDAADQHQPAANQSALTSTTSLSADPNQQLPDGQDQSSWNSTTTLPPQSSQADTDGGHRSSQTSTTTVPANESQLSSDGQLQSRETTTTTLLSNQQTSTTVNSADPSQLAGDGGGDSSQTSTTSVPADPGQLDSNGQNGSTHATTTATLSADPNLSDDAGQLGSPHNATTSPPVDNSQDEGDGQHGPVQTNTTAFPGGSGAGLSSTPPSATADVSPPGSTTSTVTSDSSITPTSNSTQRHTDRPRLCTCQKVTCAPTSPPPLDPDLLPTIPLKATRKNRQRYESTWTEGTVSTLTITTVSITICSVVVVAVVAMDVRQLVVDFQRLHAVK